MPISKERILKLSHGLKNSGVRACYFFLYLSGCRVSEATKVKPGDIEIKDNCIIANIITLKNRLKGLRNIPIAWFDCEIETKMGDYVLNHIRKVPENTPVFPYSRFRMAHNLGKLVINDMRGLHGKQWVNIPEFHIHPHYLRHCRLTHLVTERNYGAVELMQFAGWTNTKPADIYVSLNWRNLAEAGRLNG